MGDKIRYTFSLPNKKLPIYIDSIGYNQQELDFDRPEGFPYYHWLQTIEGEGLIVINDQQFVLKKGQGILFGSYTPHKYQPNYQNTSLWSTVYLTFSGATIESIFETLEMNGSFTYQETKKGVFYRLIEDIFDYLKADQEKSPVTHYDLSAKLYKFIIQLKKYGEVDQKIPQVQSHEKIRPIVEWLEQVYHKNIGLLEISEQAGISAQHLNKLFHETFEISPYAFLVQVRIREAKRLLLTDTDLPLKEIAKRVGFNAVSHFVSTFKSREKMTPIQYRELHSDQETQINYHLQ